MRLMRGHLRDVFQSIRINPQITFVFFATFLTLAEELITTLLTNLAPVFGVPMGACAGYWFIRPELSGKKGLSCYFTLIIFWEQQNEQNPSLPF